MATIIQFKEANETAQLIAKPLLATKEALTIATINYLNNTTDHNLLLSINHPTLRHCYDSSNKALFNHPTKKYPDKTPLQLDKYYPANADRLGKPFPVYIDTEKANLTTLYEAYECYQEIYKTVVYDLRTMILDQKTYESLAISLPMVYNIMPKNQTPINTKPFFDLLNQYNLSI